MYGCEVFMCPSSGWGCHAFKEFQGPDVEWSLFVGIYML